MSTPVVGKVYVGSPGIQPAWLAGRRLLVEEVVTRADLVKMRGGRLRPGADDGAVVDIYVKAMSRNRVTFEAVEAQHWHAEAK